MDDSVNRNTQSYTRGQAANTEAVFFERQMVIFFIGKEEFGVDISDVREIINYSVVTKIPGTEDYVDGIINLRGGIVVVVDLAKKIGLAESQKNIHTRVIVMEVAGSTVGFIVDGCSEVLRLTGDKIHSPPSILNSKVHGEYVQSVGILNDRMIIVVDLARVISAQDIAGLSGKSDVSSAVSKKILMVEDSTLMRSTLKSFMPREIDVIEAADGEKALDIFSKEQENIGLVLLDIKLPGMNGIDVLKELLKQNPKLNVVMETSVYDDTTKDTCLKMGAKDYLKKPISKKQMDDTILKYLYN